MPWRFCCSMPWACWPCTWRSACSCGCRGIRSIWRMYTPDSAFNTAVSFVTNTNWQGYSGESALSYFTQMTALAVQNFFSAATGIAVAFALIRGFARRSAQGIGNFWVDLTRSTLYILLPASLLLAVIFMGQGVIQNFDAYQEVNPLESLTYTQPKLDAAGQPLQDAGGVALTETLTTHTQTLAMGPVASQEAIKMLGTNGGGFFNANSAHPYENPTPLSNFLQMIAMFPDSRRPVLHVWPHGGGLAPGLGGVLRHDLDLCRDGDAGDLGRVAGQPPVPTVGCGSVGQRLAGGRKHGG